jgi:hypothetical protein
VAGSCLGASCYFGAEYHERQYCEPGSTTPFFLHRAGSPRRTVRTSLGRAPSEAGFRSAAGCSLPRLLCRCALAAPRSGTGPRVWGLRSRSAVPAPPGAPFAVVWAARPLELNVAPPPAAVFPGYGLCALIAPVPRCGYRNS